MRSLARHPALLAATLLLGGCASTSAPGFPPPARPGVLVATDFETTFLTVLSLVESRGIPVLVADRDFGNVITEWIEWAPGEVDLSALADCDLREDTPVSAARGRFAFEVRPRANRAQVTALTHYQVERHPGFDDSDRGYVDCASTGEWERAVYDALGGSRLRP